MRLFQLARCPRVLVPAAVLFQITACLGPDPQLFVTSSIANAVLANLVTLVFASLAGAAA